MTSEIMKDLEKILHDNMDEFFTEYLPESMVGPTPEQRQKYKDSFVKIYEAYTASGALVRISYYPDQEEPAKLLEKLKQEENA